MNLLSFIKRDILITLSYKFNLALQAVKIALSLLMFYFIGETFGTAMSTHLGKYGGSYFSFVLIGYAVSIYISAGLDAISSDVRSAQVEGTLEALLCTPSSIYSILIGNSLWTFISAFIQSIVLIIFGVLFLGLKFSILIAIKSSSILILTLIIFIIIGMLSASFIMIFKRGDPIKLLLGTSSYFIGGIVFPVEVLPRPIQLLSEIIPITHSIKILRELFLTDNHTNYLNAVIKLAIFICIISPISIALFRYAVSISKKNGSLVQF
jgi:ABC-2 type transport system permease protein